MKTKALSLIALAAVATALVVRAEPEVYFGQDISPWPPGTNHVARLDYTNSLHASTLFLARLAGTATESFESFAPGSSPLTATFGTNTATFSGDRKVFEVTDPTTTREGDFPTSGSRYIVIFNPAGGPSFLTLTFNQAQASLGFFATDIEVNQLQIVLVRPDGTRRTVPVPVTTPQSSGGACYLGIIDRADPFIAVIFQNLGTSADGFGIDDLTIGTADQIRPDPAVLAIQMYPGLWVTGTVGATYRIEYADIINSSTWNPLTNILLPASPFFYVDTTATNQNTRYYRAIGIEPQ